MTLGRRPAPTRDGVGAVAAPDQHVAERPGGGGAGALDVAAGPGDERVPGRGDLAPAAAPESENDWLATPSAARTIRPGSAGAPVTGSNT